MDMAGLVPNSPNLIMYERLECVKSAIHFTLRGWGVFNKIIFYNVV